MKRSAISLAVALSAVPVLLSHSAQSEEIPIDKPIIHFPVNALGGIRTILRYQTAAASEIVTAILFLENDEPLPMEVTVEDSNQAPITVRDIEGADCTVEHVALFKAGIEVALVVAGRDDGHMRIGQAEPAPFNVQTYQLVKTDGVGGADIVFKASGDPLRTRPLCSLTDVQAAIVAVAGGWRPSAVKP